MVKGVARHAVIVRSPDLKEFEQAIFIISGQGEDRTVKSPEEMLRLACSLAADYSVKSVAARRVPRWLRPAAWFAAGSAATGALWWGLSALPL